MLRQVFLSVVFITAHDTKFHVMGQVAGMYFGEEKKETRLRRRLRGRTLPEKAVTPSSVEGGAGFWQRWSLSEQVPVGAGPWRPVRVRGFRMSRHWPLHCRQAGRASRPFGRGRGRNAPSRPAAGRRGGGGGENRPVVERPALPGPRCPKRGGRSSSARPRGGTDTPAMGAREGAGGRGG